MKNMKTAQKLAVSFSIMIVLAIIICLVGINGMSSINAADDDLYNHNVIALQALGSMRENFVMLQRDLRTCMLRDSQHPKYIAARQRITSLQEEMQEHLAMYSPTISTKEDEKLFADFTKLYAEYQTALGNMIRLTDKIGPPRLWRFLIMKVQRLPKISQQLLRKPILIMPIPHEMP